METAKFFYVTYIAATPEKLWDAIVEPDVAAKYWQHINVSDWKPGSRWEHHRAGKQGAPLLVGRIIEVSRPQRLVLTWAVPADEEREEKRTRVTFEFEPMGDVTRLTLTHDRLALGSHMHHDIAEGWPRVLASLKTLMETGQALPELWGETATQGQGKQR